jgi:hypothetical protein
MATPELARPDLSLPASGNAAMTVLLTNADSAGIEPTWVALPGSGQLEVNYRYTDEPAAAALLVHENGASVPLLPGDHIYTSMRGDALYVAMAFEGQSIKVGWAYV